MNNKHFIVHQGTWETPFPEEDPSYTTYWRAFEVYVNTLCIPLEHTTGSSLVAATGSPVRYQRICQQPTYITYGTLTPYQLDGIRQVYFLCLSSY
jgi:hypothetical protein